MKRCCFIVKVLHPNLVVSDLAFPPHVSSSPLKLQVTMVDVSTRRVFILPAYPPPYLIPYPFLHLCFLFRSSFTIPSFTPSCSYQNLLSLLPPLHSSSPPIPLLCVSVSPFLLYTSPLFLLSRTFPSLPF